MDCSVHCGAELHKHCARKHCLLGRIGGNQGTRAYACIVVAHECIVALVQTDGGTLHPDFEHRICRLGAQHHGNSRPWQLHQAHGNSIRLVPSNCNSATKRRGREEECVKRTLSFDYLRCVACGSNCGRGAPSAVGSNAVVLRPAM